MHYDPNLDRSEEFGWKKWSEEQQPTEEEQEKWAKWSVFVSTKISLLALLLQY